MTKIRYLLSLNRYSRSGKKNTPVKGIVLHQGENEGYGAIETRNYFDNLKSGKNAVYYSTHYIVGFEGEIIQCVPEEEVSNHRGNGGESQGYISITCCFRDKNTEPDIRTRQSLKVLVRDIAKRYDFNIDSDFLRHFDISGIKCPKFYVLNDDKWKSLKREIRNESEAVTYLEEKSCQIAERLSCILDIDRGFLTEILEEKASVDIVTLSRIARVIANDSYQ